MKNKIRILHIVQCPGGVERYIQMLIKNMDNNRFEHVLVCSYDYYEENYNEILVSFKHVLMENSISFVNDLKAVIEVRKLIKNIRPNIIYCHSSKAGFIGRIANIGIHKKIIYNSHGWAFNMVCSKARKLTYIFVEQFLSIFTTHFIAISDMEKQSAIKNKVCKNKKITVIRNGIELSDINKCFKSEIIQLKKKYGIADDARIVGMVGRISQQKSPDIFIEMAALIKKQMPNVHFMIVGDGPLNNEIFDLAKSKGLENSLTITGWVDDVSPYQKMFDVGVLLSRWEGFGLVLAEYMAMRVPIVASNVDAIPELIQDGVNGFLNDVNNAASAAENVLCILNDDKIKNSFIHNGEIIVTRDFNIKRVAKMHESLIEILCLNN